MKKKLFLIVAIIIIAVFACMTLVACGGNDGNSGNNEFVEGDSNNGGNNQGEDNNGGNQDNENIVSPDATLKEFLDVWLKSSQKSFYQPAYGDATIVINGNIYWQFDFEDTKYVEITGKNKANYFFGPKGSTNLDNWEIMKLETIDEICNSVNIEEEYLQVVNSPKDILNFAYSICFNDADLDVVFEKKGDIYIGKQGTDFENYTIKIADKVLTLTMVNELNGEQQSMDFMFTLGSESIEIPEFLRDALDNLGEEQPPESLITPKEFMDKYIASNEKVCLLVENQRTQKLSLKGNIIKYKENYDDELLESYYELVNDDINCYDYSNGWSASTIAKNKMTEGDYYDLSNVANTDFMRELFNKGQDFGLYGWLGHLEYIALAFDLDNLNYIDGAYYGKTGTDAEGNKFEVIENKFIVTYLSDDPNYSFIITFELGCSSIEIPQEAKDALENGGNNQEENKVIPSEFFAKFNVATDKKLYLKKDNIIRGVVLNGNKASIELIENNIRHYEIFEFTEQYVNDYGLIDGAWQAYPYTYDKASCDNAPELFNEGMAEVFDVTGSSDLLEVIAASYNIENLVYADGKYTGKVGTILEGYIITVSNNELVFKNDVVEFTYTIGGIQIDIPQEALDAMEEYWQQEQAA